MKYWTQWGKQWFILTMDICFLCFQLEATACAFLEGNSCSIPASGCIPRRMLLVILFYSAHIKVRVHFRSWKDFQLLYIQRHPRYGKWVFTFSLKYWMFFIYLFIHTYILCMNIYTHTYFVLSLVTVVNHNCRFCPLWTYASQSAFRFTFVTTQQ